MPSKWPAFTAESPHPDKVVKHTVQSNTPEVLDAPQNSPSTEENSDSSNASDLLDRSLPIVSATISESGSSRSSEPGSLSTDLTSYTPSATHIYNDLASGV